MIDFFMTRKWLFGVFALLLAYGSGYREADEKARAKQTALIAAYQHSAAVAAEQYAAKLKAAQEEKQRWYDYSQKQSVELAAALGELDKTRNTLQEQTREAVEKDGGGFSGIGTRSLHLYNRAFGYAD